MGSISPFPASPPTSPSLPSLPSPLPFSPPSSPKIIPFTPSLLSASPIFRLLSFLLHLNCSHASCRSSSIHSSCLLAVIRSLRQGVVFGAKLRFPHALVMTFLFRCGTLGTKIREILGATYQHSRNLGCYAALYKFLTCSLKHLRGVDDGWTSIIAGGIGAPLIFGENNSVNSQINFYVLSRVLFTSARVLVSKGWFPSFEHSYILYVSLIWATSMYLFEWEDKRFAPKSVTDTMQYLYKDSDHWKQNPTGFIDWIVN